MCFLYYFYFFFGVVVGLEVVDVWNDVEGDLFWEFCWFGVLEVE